MPVLDTSKMFADWKLKVLLYGRSGSGKTYLAATAALVKELCPIYWFATERGMLSIKTFIETGRVRVCTGVSEADLVALQNVIASPGKIKTVIIDSLSELHALILRVQQAKGNHEDTPSRNDFRTGHDRILKLLRYIDGHATVHVIATANDQPLIDGETGRVLSIDPDMAGKLSFRTGRYFDGVYYLNSKSVASLVPGRAPTVSRWLQVQSYDGVTAKDRSPEGKLGSTLVDPTMAKIYTALVGPCTELPATRTDDAVLLV